MTVYRCTRSSFEGAPIDRPPCPEAFSARIGDGPQPTWFVRVTDMEQFVDTHGPCVVMPACASTDDYPIIEIYDQHRE